jgi:nucleoside-diphosphate-sugar epimerase
MKIFLTGATGVLGRPVVNQLVAEGHDVYGVARGQAKADTLRAAGARPVAADLFDAAAVGAAVGQVRPDVIVHLATHIPPAAAALRPGGWRVNDRLRRDTSRYLVDAALAHGVGRYLQESISFGYRDGGGSWLDEDSPLAGGPQERTTAASARQAARLSAAGGAGVLLRFGAFYGASSRDTRMQLERARAGKAAMIGPPEAYISMIKIEDAGAAVAAALRAPGGVYNVVDDVPERRREVNRQLAEALGVTPPPLVPAGLLRLFRRTRPITRSQRVSNRRFVDATGWHPRHADAADGLRAVVAELAAAGITAAGITAAGTTPSATAGTGRAARAPGARGTENRR